MDANRLPALANSEIHTPWREKNHPEKSGMQLTQMHSAYGRAH
jgi:hypothetical protein